MSTWRFMRCSPIDTQPASKKVYAGDGAVFSTAVSGGIPAVTYQWQANLGGGFQNLPEGYLGVITGVHTNTLNFATTLLLMNGALVHCIINAQPSDDPMSSAIISATTSDVTLNVYTPLSISTPGSARAYTNAPGRPGLPAFRHGEQRLESGGL